MRLTPQRSAKIDIFLSVRVSQSERAMLMDGACAKACGWSPRGRAIT